MIYYVLHMSVPGCLQTSDGAVLKPALGGNKGLREVDFYQELFSADCQDRVLLDLRHLVPKFLGVWTTPEHPGCKFWFTSKYVVPFLTLF